MWTAFIYSEKNDGKAKLKQRNMNGKFLFLNSLEQKHCKKCYSIKHCVSRCLHFEQQAKGEQHKNWFNVKYIHCYSLALKPIHIQKFSHFLSFWLCYQNGSSLGEECTQTIALYCNYAKILANFCQRKQTQLPETECLRSLARIPKHKSQKSNVSRAGI